MKNLKLATAVLTIVREFHSSGKEFSAHSVTSRLREEVNNKRLCVTDVGALDGVSQILHPQVKELVHELFDNDLLPLERREGPGYLIYYSDAAQAPAPARSVTKTVPATPQAKASATVSTNVNTESLILSYVNRKITKQELPTLKSVQSALKSVPVTTEQVAKICLSNGFKVAPQAGLKRSLSVIYK